MSYNKLGFTSGQTLKAEHLNHMEEGIANAGGPSFIDVLDLPTENIQVGMFYRLTTAAFAYEGGIAAPYTIYCVDELPEAGEPVTDVSQSIIVAYFNVNSRTIHGYIDDMLSAGLGIPSGWYGEELFDAFDVDYGGVIIDISESEGKGALCVLIEHQMYFYDNGWCKAVFGYENAPKFDFRWNGIIGNRFVLDLSQLGYENSYFVKINDEVLTTEDCVGSTFYTVSGDEELISSDMIDTDSFPGAITISNRIVVVHSSADLNSAFGLPVGYITNGIYFLYNLPIIDEDTQGSLYFITRFVAPSKIAKIGAKYLDESGIFDIVDNIYTEALLNYYNKSEVDIKIASRVGWGDVYTKSEVDTKIANSGGNIDLSVYAKKSDLSDYAKTTDVQSMIAEAIGSAIGGGY